MDLLPDADQSAIAQTARELVADHAPVDRLLTVEPGAAVDAAFWKVAADTGLLGLGLAHAQGGAGLGLAEETLVFRELGRGLAPGPFLGTVLAARVAAAADLSGLAEEIAAGRAVGLVEQTPQGWQTIDPEPELWLVLTPEHAELHGAAVVESLGRPVDVATRPARVTVQGAPLARVAKSTYDAWRHGALLVAAMLSGIAQATVDQSAAFVQVRQQFGAPIGSFQAVKHRCADMAVRSEALEQGVTLAALSVDAGRSDADLLWPSARLLAGRWAIDNAGDNIQNHGAIGYTAEHTAHLFLKRAHALSTVLGTDMGLREQLLDAPSARVL